MFFPFFRHAFVYRTLATIVLEPAAACPVLPDVSSLQPVTASLSTQSFAFSFSAMLFPCLIDFGLLYGIVKKHVRLIFSSPLLWLSNGYFAFSLLYLPAQCLTDILAVTLLLSNLLTAPFLPLSCAFFQAAPYTWTSPQSWFPKTTPSATPPLPEFFSPISSSLPNLLSPSYCSLHNHPSFTSINSPFSTAWAMKTCKYHAALRMHELVIT